MDNLEDILVNKNRDVVISNEDLIQSKDDADDDSSDDSSDDDTAEEYMPDGEVVRKNSRGFKQLKNCKRFWEASVMIGKRKLIIFI